MKSITLTLPEPPSFNEMIRLAKMRTRKTKNGGWLKKPAPIVYDNHKAEYEATCLFAVMQSLASQGIKLPRKPWGLWKLSSAHFKLHNERDPLELLAGLKWTVDALVNMGMLANDSPRHLKGIPDPTQEIDRKNRCVVITINQVGEI
jgi:hypothetical protein